jgi:hypothetical protein
MDKIKYKKGMEMEKEIGEVKYIEWSELKKKGMKKVLDEEIRAVLCKVMKVKKKRRCVLM